MIAKELKDLLKSYLKGKKTVRDCAEWLAGIDWDDPNLDSENHSIAGRLELLSTEVLEGLRPEDDFTLEAFRLIAKKKTPAYQR